MESKKGKGAPRSIRSLTASPPSAPQLAYKPTATLTFDGITKVGHSGYFGQVVGVVRWPGV